MNHPRTPAPDPSGTSRPEASTEEERGAFGFGPFLLLADTLELERDGKPVALAAQPSRLLTMLVTRRGAVVSRQEIAELLWPDRVVEVDTGINAAIRQIRSALGESGSAPRYVETLPRIGYRMKATVRRVEATDWKGGSPTPATRVRRRGSLAMPVAAAFLVLLLSGVASWWLGTGAQMSLGSKAGFLEDAGSGAKPSAVAASVPRLAVLPTRDLSRDAANAALASGLTEDLIAELTQLTGGRMEVISRTSSSRFATTDVWDADSTRSIGDELGADYLLQASVRREGDRVRLTGQLLRVRDQRQQWAQRFDRVADSALDLQLELAQAVASSITPEILVDGAEPPLSLGWDPAAREDFLLGRYLVQNGSVEEGMFRIRRALDVDPDIGPAWLWLARAGGRHPDRWTPEQRRGALEQALRVDSRQADAHLELGRLALYGDWDVRAAESHYRRALEVDPLSSPVHHALAMLLGIRGSFTQAVEHLDVARRLDPVSSLLHGDGAQVLLMAGDLDGAEQACRLVEELGEGAPGAAQCFFDVALERSDLSGALARADHLLAARGAPEDVRRAVADPGRDPDVRLRRFYSWSVGFFRQIGASPVAQADALLGTGDVDAAFEMLEVALAERRADLLMVPSHPRARRFRDDPRLQSIVSRMGIDHVDAPVRAAHLEMTD